MIIYTKIALVLVVFGVNFGSPIWAAVSGMIGMGVCFFALYEISTEFEIFGFRLK